MLLALGLGLPLGTQGWRDAVAFAHEHPTLFWAENIAVIMLILACGWWAGRQEDS